MEVIENINQRLKEMAEHYPDWVVRVLENIDNAGGVKVPDQSVIETLLSKHIGVEENEKAVESYRRIKQIAFKFWNENYGSILLGKATNIINQYSQNLTSINLPVEFAFEIIKDLFEIDFTPSQTPESLFLGIWRLYSRTSSHEEKLRVMKCYIVCTSWSKDEGSHWSNILTELTGGAPHVFYINLEILKKIMEFIKEQRNKGEWWKRLEQEIIARVLSQYILNNILNASKIKILYKNHKDAFPRNVLENFLKKFITNADENQIKNMEGFLLDILNDKDLQGLLITLFQNRISSKRETWMLNYFLDLIEKTGNPDMKRTVGEWILESLERQSPNLITGRVLEHIKNWIPEKFKEFINKKVKNLLSKHLSDTYTPCDRLYELLEFQEYWDKENIETFFSLVIQLLLSGKDNLRVLAYECLTKGIPFPKGKRKVLIEKIKEIIPTLLSEEEKKKWYKIIEKYTKKRGRK